MPHALKQAPCLGLQVKRDHFVHFICYISKDLKPMGNSLIQLFLHVCTALCVCAHKFGACGHQWVSSSVDLYLRLRERERERERETFTDLGWSLQIYLDLVG